MVFRSLLLLFVFLTFLSITLGKRNLIITARNFTCTSHQASFEMPLNCTISRYSPDPIVSVSFILNKAVNKFDINISLDVIKKDNTIWNIGRRKVDGCKYIEFQYSNMVYGQFFKGIQKASNIPKKCPFLSNKLYEIKNYKLIVEELAPATPSCTFKTVLTFTSSNTVLAEAIFHGTTNAK